MLKVSILSALSTLQRMTVFNLKNSCNSIHTTVANQLKEIKATRSNNTLTIEGVQVQSPRTKYLIKIPSECCPLCRLNLDVKHTDVLILSQFVRPDGCMMPQRITGLCRTQQKRISKMVSMAHKAGLMCNITLNDKVKDPSKRKDWKKYNTYYDESTIKVYENHFQIARRDIISKYLKSSS
ncbi:28S ribosomal protein S18a, mitochondrial [Daktulosphaira vitifoliae]|uniref:28S ribosomal protein S18a, mitochondrial n=1 Tax=Daktulosphaira vitifoliae TaxID=58002 RepID=UPI0021AA4638|nr:28S ribosomal protein S18a, mitochondrial [Daktulosphaira vitifoliae]